MGWRTPISLLMVIMETSAVSGLMAASRSCRADCALNQLRGKGGGPTNLEVNDAVLLHWQVGDLHTLVLHSSARVQHTLVLLNTHTHTHRL